MGDRGEGVSRRALVKMGGGAGAAAAIGVSGFGTAGVEAQPNTAPGPDAAERDLALAALDAARSSGARYADVRIILTRTESVATRERQITNVAKGESFGVGVRAFVG